ncbi:vegetative incompatibility protein HET-E-1, partial [Rhizoctonia solani AG-3 Rhs1AP]
MVPEGSRGDIIKHKDSGNDAWKGLISSLHTLESSSGLFPPLKAAVGAVIGCIGVVQRATSNRADQAALAEELQFMVETLNLYSTGLESESKSGSIANLAQDIQRQVEDMKQLDERSTIGRFLDVARDEENVIRLYRQIKSLFRRLQCDVSMRTHDHVKKQVETTLLRGMLPVDDARYNSSYSTTINRNGCTAETREAIHQALEVWTINPESEKIYWMNGMAGTGKTTIAYSFCEWLENTNRLGASFFCSRISPTCRSLNKIVPTIAYQLAQYSPRFRSALCTALEVNPDAGTLNVMQQFEKLVKYPLLNAKDAMPDSVVVMIDALDECDYGFSAPLLLDVLLKFAGPLPVKFFVSSRPEPLIWERMTSQGGTARSILHLHDIEKWIVEEDIKKYLTKALSSMKPPPLPMQLDLLVKSSRNLFIYAATVVHYIVPNNVHVDSKARLRSILATISDPKADPENTYEDLDRLYTTVLKALKFNICALDNSYLTDNQVDDLEARVSHHLQVAPVTDTTRDMLLDFISNRFLFWIEVLSLSRCIGIGAPMMQKAQAWLERIKNTPNQVHSHVSDARNFVTWFAANPCSQSTPHIYISALPLCSKSNWVYQHYSPRTKGLAKISTSQYDNAVLAIWNTESAVNSVAISPDGNHIASGNDAGSVQVYDMHTGAPAADLSEGHTAVVLSVAFSLDGRYIASGSSDETVIIWDVHTGRIVTGPLHKHTNSVWSVAFSPDGTHIVSGAADETIILWDTATGTILFGPLQGHSDEVTSVAFSPNGRLIASGSYDTTIGLWHASTGSAAAKPFRGHTAYVTMVTFSPDGSKLASCSTDETIRVWDVQTGVAIVRPFQGHKDGIFTIAFSFDGSHIASGGGTDGKIMVWNTLTGSLVLGPLSGHTSAVRSVKFSPDNTRIASCSDDRTIRIWDVQTKVEDSDQQNAHEVSVGSVSFLPDCIQLISGSTSGLIHTWNMFTGLIDQRELEGQAELPMTHTVAVSSKGTLFAASAGDLTIRVWSVLDGKLASHLLQGHSDLIGCLAFSPDNAHLCSGSDDSTIVIWDIEKGSTIGQPYKGHAGAVISVAYSPDGTHIASGATDCTVRVWHLSTGMLVHTLNGHNNSVSSAVFSPDGSLIVSGSVDGIVKKWEIGTDSCSGVSFEPDSGTYSGSSSERPTSVNSVYFSPDGTQLVCGFDSFIRMLDPQTMNHISELSLPLGEKARWVGYSPDGACIVSVSISKDAEAQGSSEGHVQLQQSYQSPNIIRFWRAAVRPDQLTSLSTPRDWSYKSDGRILSSEGFVMWIPPDLIPHMKAHTELGSESHNSSLVLSSDGFINIGYPDLCIGNRWSECYPSND